MLTCTYYTLLARVILYIIVLYGIYLLSTEVVLKKAFNFTCILELFALHCIVRNSLIYLLIDASTSKVVA